MNDCIFCKIVKKEVPAKIVYENDFAVAFLDIHPRSKGMCLVVPKEHVVSFDQNFELSSKLFDVALTVAEKIIKSLNPLTVFFSIIQTQVPHFHIRVYPVYEDQMPLGENKPIEITEGELDELAQKINSVDAEWGGRQAAVNKEPVKEEPKEKEPEEKRTDDELYWMKRETKLA